MDPLQSHSGCKMFREGCKIGRGPGRIPSYLDTHLGEMMSAVAVRNSAGKTLCVESMLRPPHAGRAAAPLLRAVHLTVNLSLWGGIKPKANTLNTAH